MEFSDDDRDPDYNLSDDDKSKSSLTDSVHSQADSEENSSSATPLYSNPLARFRPVSTNSSGKNSAPSPLAGKSGSNILTVQEWTDRMVELSQGTGESPHQFRSCRILLHGIPSSLTDPSNAPSEYGSFFFELYRIGERTGLPFHESRIRRLLKSGAWEIFPNPKSLTHSMILPLEEQRMFSVAPTQSQFPIFLNLNLPWLGLSSGDPVIFLGDYSIQAIPTEFTKLSDIGDELVIFRGIPTDTSGAGTEAFLFLLHEFLTANSHALADELAIITYPHYTSRLSRSQSAASQPQSLFKEWLCIAYYTDSSVRARIREELALPLPISSRLVHFPAWTLIMTPSIRTALSASIAPLVSAHRICRVRRIKQGLSFGEALAILGSRGDNVWNLPSFPMGWMEMGQWHGPQNGLHNSIVLLNGEGPEIPLEILGFHQALLGTDENGRNRVEVWCGNLDGTGKQTAFYDSRRPKPKAAPKKPSGPNQKASVSSRASRPTKQTPVVDRDGFTQVSSRRPKSTPLSTPNLSAPMRSSGGGASVSSLGGRSYLSATRSDQSSEPDLRDRLPHTLQRGYNIRFQLRREDHSREGLSDLTKALWETWKAAHPTSLAQLKRLSPSDLVRADLRRQEMNGPDPPSEPAAAIPLPRPPDLHLARFLGHSISSQCKQDVLNHGKSNYVNELAWLKWKGEYPAQIPIVRAASDDLQAFWARVAEGVRFQMSMFDELDDHPIHALLLEGVQLYHLSYLQALAAPSGSCWSTPGALDRWQQREPELAQIIRSMEHQRQTGVDCHAQVVELLQNLIEQAQSATLQAEHARQNLPIPPSDLVLLKGFIIQSRIRASKTGSDAKISADIEWADWTELHQDHVTRVRRPSAEERITWESQYSLAQEEMENVSSYADIQEVLWEGLLLRAIRDSKTESGKITDYLPFQQWQEDFPEAQTILHHTDPRNTMLRSQTQRRIDSRLALSLYEARRSSGQPTGVTTSGDHPLNLLSNER